MFAYACLPCTSYWPDHDGVKVALIVMLSAIVLLAHRKNLVEEIPALPLIARTISSATS